jgi:hypothetical protein
MDTFDPLEHFASNAVQESLKRRIGNILGSYQHASDVLIEPVQNAIDEVSNAGNPVGVVEVSINTDQGTISVRDNGRGMSLEDVKRYLAPDQGNKDLLFKQGKVRGHKGVGLTFLAYGFESFELESRTVDGEHFRVRLEGGREWAMADPETDIAPPRASVMKPQAEDSRLSGTGVLIRVRTGQQTLPRNLRRAFPSAEYSATLLESLTAIGVVPPYDNSHIELRPRLVFVKDGDSTEVDLRPAFRFWHKGLPKRMKIIDLDDYRRSNPAATVPPASMRNKATACHMTMDADRLAKLVASASDLTAFDNAAELIDRIKKYRLSVYGLFAYASDFRDSVAEGWSVPKERTIVKPGSRIATDGMMSTWFREPTLAHRGHNVTRVWLLFHFMGVKPDLGRKDFGADVLEIVRVLEEPFANTLFRAADPFLKPVPRGRKYSEDAELAADKAQRRLTTPLEHTGSLGGGGLPLLSAPEEEQDVVGLFSMLAARGTLAHFPVVFLSGFDEFDGWFEYDQNAISPEVTQRLPGSAQIEPKLRKGPLEFKLRGCDLLDDVNSETKDWLSLRLLVCWETGGARREAGGDAISFTEIDDDSDRLLAGTTHLATLDSKGDVGIPVIELRSLLGAMAKPV